MKITLFYITNENKEAATFICNLAIEHKLAACGNIFQIDSIFPWEGTIQNDGECILLLKTIPEKTEQLRDFIGLHHPYAVPCIVSWDAEANESYGNWINDMMHS